MGSRRLCQALSSKFKLREACYLLLPAVIAVGLSAEVSPAASDLPSNQQVIALLTESIGCGHPSLGRLWPLRSYGLSCCCPRTYGFTFYRPSSASAWR